jgi:hypothetical protein
MIRRARNSSSRLIINRSSERFHGDKFLVGSKHVAAWPMEEIIVKTSDTEPRSMRADRTTARRREQVTAAAGLATAVAFVGELATWGNPHLSDPLSKVTDYFVTHGSMALASIGLGLLGAVALLIFGAGIRAILSGSDGRHDVLPTLVLGAAVLFASTELTFTTTTGALVLVAGEASRGEVRMLLALENMADLFRFLPIGVLIGAASLAMLGRRDFARWLGWLGVVSGALLLIGEGGVLTPADGGGNISDVGMVGLLLFLIWVTSASINLLRSRATSATAQAAPAAAERLTAQG